MADKGNTEGTPQPGDSVETGRGASVDWSNLREDYARLGSILKVAGLYGIGQRAVRAEMMRRGFERRTRSPGTRNPIDWSNLPADYEELGTMIAVGKRYGVRSTAVREELVRQGIPVNPRGVAKGTPKSQAWREASAKNWNDPAWREQQRQRWLERLPTMNGPAANSPLEKLLHRALRKAGISFSTQRVLLGRYCVDILIAQKPVVIEADGNVHLRQKDKDARRDADLRAAGYEVFRFTGKPISTDPDGCIRQVIESAALAPDKDPVYDIRNGMTGADNPKWSGGKQEWVCDNCGGTFLSWKRGYGRLPRFCNRECQSAWQRTSKASVTGRRSNGDRMRELWADPEWRERTTQRQRAGRWPERQTVVQSELHEPREDVQS